MRKMASNLSINDNVNKLVRGAIPVSGFFLLVGWVFYIAGSIEGAPWPVQVLPWKMLGGTCMYISGCILVMISIPYFAPVSRAAWARVLTIIACSTLALLSTFLCRNVFVNMYPPIWLDYIVATVSAAVCLSRQVGILRI